MILRGTISAGEWRFSFFLRKWGWEENELEEEDGGFESKQGALQFGVWMASLGRGHSVSDSQHMFCVFVIAGVGICWKSLWHPLSAQCPRTNASSYHLKPLVNIWTFFLLQWKEIFLVDYRMWLSEKHTVFSIIEGKGGHWAGPRYIWVLPLLLWDLRGIVWPFWAPDREMKKMFCLAKEIVYVRILQKE